jgi:DNA-binding transcriptional ArsR family regulator
MGLSETLQALSDPTRRQIIRLLNEKDLTAGQIATNFDMSAPSVSHHLNVLKGADLIRAERQGQTLVYSLNATVVQEFLYELMGALSVGQPRKPRKLRTSGKE